MSKKEISWILKARDSVSSVLQRVGQSFVTFAKSGYKVAKDFAKGISAIGAAAVAIGARMVRMYQVQAQAEAKLTAVLRATGYAAGFTTSELKKYASELQKQTGIGDEVILSTQAILASFKEIKGDRFLEATEAVADMATVMANAAQDAASIEQQSIQVGKALNDPIRGISALSRVGVQFTEQQRQQIQIMQESGDIYGAQGIILKELQNEFGGAAKGIDKNVKAYRAFREALGDAQEEMGRVLTENMQLSDVFESFSGKLQHMQESGLIEYWAESIVDAVRWIIENLKPLSGALGFIENKIRETAGFWGAVSGGSSFEEASMISTALPDEMRKDREAGLQRIRDEREARRQARADAEQSEMKQMQAQAEINRLKDEDIRIEEALAEMSKRHAGEVDDIAKGLRQRIQLQELLNRGMETEAEIMQVQHQLGRELSEQEKERLGGLIERMRSLESERSQMQRSESTPGLDNLGTQLLRIGGMMHSGAADMSSREGLALDKTRNLTLESINANIRNLKFDMEMR